MNESSKANDHGTPEQPADAAPESVEPEITAPELGAAEISEDVAETVDLHAAEAEAAAVEQEARLTARRVSAGLGTPDAGAVAAPAAGSPFAPMTAALPPEPEAAPAVPQTSEAEATAVPEAQTVDAKPVGAAAEETVQAPDDEATTGIFEASDSPHATTPETAVPVAEAAGEESAVDPSEEGQSTGDTASEGTAPKEPGHIGPGIADGHGWRRPVTKWEQSSTPWKPKGESWQSPAQISRKAADAAAEAAAAGTGDVADSTLAAVPVAAATPALPAVAVPAAAPAPAAKAPDTAQPSGSTQSEGNPKKILIVAGIALVGLALLVAFIMLLVGLFSGGGENGAAPISGDSSLAQQSLVSANATAGAESDLVVAEVSPLDWMEGDCLRDFKDTSTAADVVLCSSPHNAQLVGTFYYGLDEAFPGVPELKTKAAQVCKGVAFTSEASALKSLKQTTAYPSESTWQDKDDRRVDCMVHDTRAGNPLSLTLTQ